MQTLADLKRRIDSTQELHSVVRTMKSLAAVNIRNYEKAVESLSEYTRTVDMALGVVLKYNPDTNIFARRSTRKRMGALVFGSDQGMCGSLNEQVVSHTEQALEKAAEGHEDIVIVCAGERVFGLLSDAGFAPEKARRLPGSIAAIAPHVQELLSTIEKWRYEDKVDHVVLFHALRESRAGFRPNTVNLLPVDVGWLESRRLRKWDSRSLPFFRMDADRLFSALIREYLFINTFRAYAESMASENAARLAAMQGAEKNIEELMEDLYSRYHHMRQMSITEELLDIVSGFEALEQEGRTS